MLPIDPSVLPEERLEGFSIQVSKGNNFVSVKAGHGLEVGDYLVVRGKNYRITDIHPDDCFVKEEGSRNMIYVQKEFDNNVKNQCFRFRKMVFVKGKMVDLKEEHMHRFRGIEIKFKEKNKNSHGIMELSFSTAVFNSSGYYTRSLAITEFDM